MKCSKFWIWIVVVLVIVVVARMILFVLPIPVKASEPDLWEIQVDAEQHSSSRAGCPDGYSMLSDIYWSLEGEFEVLGNLIYGENISATFRFVDEPTTCIIRFGDEVVTINCDGFKSEPIKFNFSLGGSVKDSSAQFYFYSLRRLGIKLAAVADWQLYNELWHCNWLHSSAPNQQYTEKGGQL